MRNIMLILFGVCILSSCTNQEKVTAPPAPKSVAEVTTAVGGKNYKTAKLGILSSFAMDSMNPVNWNMMKDDTSKFFQDYAKKQMAFVINFSKDSAVSFMDTDEKKDVKGVYSIDNDAKLGYDEEKPGIKLRVKYKGTMDLGENNLPSDMTQSYLVRGINDKELILETGRSYNDHKLVVWMKAE